MQRQTFIFWTLRRTLHSTCTGNYVMVLGGIEKNISSVLYSEAETRPSKNSPELKTETADLWS